ncbi:phosphosulfolactate synthase [Lacticaseibacillus zhaodongensis]|uniref:phosphosulfolactate synthase n=1 Tax=Lacticaseibacillus zhaodongensis TaxID=2668065 RepID=UPI0012D306E0|nr:phosphosulfolactate synthase [Lacticaseibacillus zhaodongensis]
MLAYDFLAPRAKDAGKTMVLDKGLGLHAAADLVQTAGATISFIKLGWGTAATMDQELVRQKIAYYKEAGIVVYPGGTLLEVAEAAGKYSQFLTASKELGFTGVEVSDGSTQISTERRTELIQEAQAAGFYVIAEVGKKNPTLDHELTPQERVVQIKQDLEAGANYVIIEAREAGKNIGIYDQNGNIIEDELATIARVGTEHLIFEAPLKSQQAALILQFGPQVNLGNIATDEATSVETLRRGLRADTVGRI